MRGTTEKYHTGLIYLIRFHMVGDETSANKEYEILKKLDAEKSNIFLETINK
jgi:hypothetical protein